MAELIVALDLPSGREATALGIEGTAWDIAYASLYLASDEAGFATGTALIVDGGYCA